MTDASPQRVRVVAAVWIRNGKLFAVRRGPGQARAGAWELPGGKVERGESDEAALIRELAEELHVTAAVHGPALDEVVHAYPELEVNLVAYEVTVPAGVEPRLTEHDACTWLDPTALYDVAWAAADVPLLGAVARRLAQGANR